MPLGLENATQLTVVPQFIVPEGQLRIAQRFSVGSDGKFSMSPEGMAERDRSFSAVPSGLMTARRSNPTLKRWAILSCPSGTLRCRRKLLVRDCRTEMAALDHSGAAPIENRRYSRLKVCVTTARLSCAIAFVLLLALAGSAIAGGIKTGDSFPDLAAFKLEGKLPDSTKGKVVLVDFWASWCEPCKQSFPAMDELHKRYADRGLVIIAVNVDENRPDMEAFLKKNAATFLVLRDANQKLVEKAGITTMPSSFLIDRDGKVRFAHTGYRGAETKKKYEEEIESLLK